MDFETAAKLSGARFVVLRGGQEVARFEGYPGAERFFEVLRVMLDEARRSA